MQTQVVTVDPDNINPEALKPVAERLRNGGIVGLPTETVYGLAVNLDHPEALRRLLELRESPLDKKVTVHIGSADAAERFARIPPCGLGRRLVSKLWPGPITLIFPGREGGDVGLRFPGHKACTEVLRLAGIRAGMPSANRSGAAPATTAAEVLAQFKDRIDYVVDAGPARIGTASTVARIAGRSVEILREGAVAKSDLDALGYYSVLFVCTGNTCRSPMAEALFRMELAKLGKKPPGFLVRSAGTQGVSGAPVSDHAVTVVRDHGGDISGHRSRGLDIAMIQDADVVYAMTRQHRGLILEWMPECRDAVHLLDPSGADIADPVGSDLETYRRCAEQIAQSARQRAREVP